MKREKLRMKNESGLFNVPHFLALLFVICSVLFVSCDLPDAMGGKGVVTINLGDSSNSRALWYGIDTDNFTLTVTVTNGPGSDQTQLADENKKAQFTLIPGTWDIIVKAYHSDEYADIGSMAAVVAEGKLPGVNINPGPNEITKSINMGLPENNRPVVCDVDFKANGATGNIPDALKIFAGVSITLPDAGNLERTDHTFGGWNTNAEGRGTGYAAGDSYTVNETASLYAMWMPNQPGTFTVTFNSNGGSPVDSISDVESGQPISEPNPPTKEGYGLDGWYREESLTTKWEFATDIVTGNITLHAKWEPLIPFTVSEAILDYLRDQSGEDTLNFPIELRISMDLSENNWKAILTAIDDANIGTVTNKYVNLNLSACTMAGTDNEIMFDPNYEIATGKEYIVVITLPDVATSIVEGKQGTSDGVTQVPPVAAFEYFNNLTSLEGKGLTSISACAFTGTDVAFTTLPDSITSIGANAFQNCTSLALTKLPKELTHIGTVAFYGCTSLITLIVPEKITSIGTSTFYGCTGLEQITLPVNLGSIDDYAFSDCMRLTTIICRATALPTLGSYVFVANAYDYNPFVNITIKVPVDSFPYYLNDSDWNVFTIEAIEE